MTKLLIIGGFLGSGKTSVILQLAKYLVGPEPASHAKVIVLENEIGTVSIDDKTLASTGLNVEPMFSGCVCCTMAGELVVNVRSIIDRFAPEWIILETTGMAYPNNVKKTMHDSMPELDCRICCLVDAKRWQRMQRVEQLAEFSGEQLEGASVVLVNKSDLVNAETLQAVDASIRGYNDETPIFHVSAAEGIATAVWERVFAEEGSGT